MRTFCLVLFVLLLVACGGGGGEETPNPPPGKIIADASRYFPLTTGILYTYDITQLLGGEGWNKTDTHEYLSATNLHGAGTWFQLVNGEENSSGPAFDGLNFLGTAKSGGYHLLNQGGSATILPNPTPAIGGTWTNDPFLGNPGDPFLNISIIHTLAAVENVTVGGTTYEDCLKIDVSGNYSHPMQFLTGTGTYWLAPDIGLVKFTMTAGPAQIASVELSSRE